MSPSADAAVDDAGTDGGIIDAGSSCDGDKCGPFETCVPHWGSEGRQDICSVQCKSCFADSDCADGGICERKQSPFGGFCVFAQDAGNCTGAARTGVTVTISAPYPGCARFGGGDCVWSVAVDFDAGTVQPSFEAIPLYGDGGFREVLSARNLGVEATQDWLADYGAVNACFDFPTPDTYGEICHTHDVGVGVSLPLIDGGTRATVFDVGDGLRPDERLLRAIQSTLAAVEDGWGDGGAPSYP